METHWRDATGIEQRHVARIVRNTVDNAAGNDGRDAAMTAITTISFVTITSVTRRTNTRDTSTFSTTTVTAAATTAAATTTISTTTTTTTTVVVTSDAHATPFSRSSSAATDSAGGSGSGVDVALTVYESFRRSLDA